MLKTILIAILVAFHLTVKAFQVPESLIQEIDTTTSDSIRMQLVLKYAYSTPDKLKTLEILKYGLEIAQQNEYGFGIVYSHYLIGLLHLRLGNYKTASNCLYEGLEKNNSYQLEFKARIMLGLAGVQYNLKNYQESLNIVKETLEEAIIDNDSAIMAHCYQNIGRSYDLLEKYDSSLYYYSAAIKVNKNLGLPEYRMNYSIIASVYQKLEQYDTALALFNKGLQVAEFSVDSCNLLMSRGKLLLEQTKTEAGIADLEMALNLALKSQKLSYIMEGSSALASAYEAKKEYAKAYQYSKLNRAYNDSSYNEKNKLEIAQIEFGYQQREFAQKLERQKLNTMVMIIGFILILTIILLVGYFMYKRKQSDQLLKEKNAEILGEEKERKRLSEELHDGLGGALAGIKFSVQSLEQANTLNGQVKAIVQKLDDVNQVVRSIAHNLAPPEFQSDSFLEVLEGHLIQFRNYSKLSIQLEFYPEEELKLIPRRVQIEIYRIIQELLNNIVKHAEATEVVIQLTLHDTYLNLIIEDNGRGFNPDTVEEGIGLSNIKSRVTLLQGAVDIDSVLNRGTVVNINLKTNIKKSINK